MYFGKFRRRENGRTLEALAANHLELGNEREFFTRGDNPYKALINTLSDLDQSGEAGNLSRINRPRLQRGLKKLLEQANGNGGGDILVVSHGITINSILEKIDASKVPEKICKNGSVSKIEFDGKGWRNTGSK